MNKAILLLTFLAVSINAQDIFNITLNRSFELKPYPLYGDYPDYCSYNSTVTLTPTTSANNNTLFTGFNVTGQAYANFTGCPAYYLTFVTSIYDKTPITYNNTQNIALDNIYVMDNITQIPYKLISQVSTNIINNYINATAQLPAFQISASDIIKNIFSKQSLFFVIPTDFKIASVSVFTLIPLSF
ncbi:hypothetical protein TTHERM_00419970 (macronuclear) [Tetrahymena thermophila SB210]|uniref:Transmembrane protein n=1 Tax=Tetrahymena thermophila (strain SB210) TaxID=312017 RepID=I7LTP0_TETTS|nr:hypothetical protein TTHERM_00419970 [Tetrahymena thermophila SB210]EAR85589.1 hypothetical protein TTHERM_00419970 [Tetrahymena thermophila SB210]|eukprot:XP_001033252.1 hypothetical protein TTHERM_00419970 [Tetrahymena thermophila SB210]